MNVKPISPDNIVGLKLKAIPDVVIESFNVMIPRKWNGYSSTITQDEIIGEIQKKSNYSRSEIYKNKWLDVEDIYRAEGWVVIYDKPAYDENYVARFEFKIKK